MKIPVSKYHSTNNDMMEEYGHIEEAKRNSQKFEILYTKYHEQIFRFIYQKLDDKEAAFDLTQQTFLNAMLNLYKYEYRQVPFASWLYRIALNEINKLFRKEKVQRTVNIDSVQVYAIIEELEEDKLEKYHPLMVDAIRCLPEEELQLIEMRYFEKRPFKEIGEILNITENNAKVKVYRILGKLKDLMSTSNEE